MYLNANSNMEKMLEPVNLAVKKLKVIQNIERIEKELETAERELEKIEGFIENAEDNLYAETDNFNATFSGYGRIYLNDGDDDLYKLGEIGPIFSVKEFISKYIHLMTSDREAEQMEIKISLNDDLLTFTLNDKEEKEECDYECDE